MPTERPDDPGLPPGVAGQLIEAQVLGKGTEVTIREMSLGAVVSERKVRVVGIKRGTLVVEAI